MKKLVFAAALLFSPLVYSQGLNYNYVEAVYITGDVDVAGTTIDGDGFGVGGSAALTDNMAFTFGYENLSFDFDIDSKALFFGVDFHTPIAPSTDVVLGIGFVDVKVSQPALGSEDDTGNIISAGIRHQLNPNVEIDAGVSRVDVFDDSSTSFGVSLLFGRKVQFGVGFATSDDSDALVFGVRANF